MIEVAVKDNGIGIKDEDQHKLFKLFGFLDRTKELNTKGVGLGLHITKNIIQQFGGEIQCKSKWEHGTTFSFLIALNKTTNKEIKVQRCLNPDKKIIYAKI